MEGSALSGLLYNKADPRQVNAIVAVVLTNTQSHRLMVVVIWLATVTRIRSAADPMDSVCMS